MCVNCRGTHGVGDQKCPVRERQFEVARVRVVQMVLSEAVKTEYWKMGPGQRILRGSL